jgi:hypothetical protein
MNPRIENLLALRTHVNKGDPDTHCWVDISRHAFGFEYVIVFSNTDVDIGSLRYCHGKIDETTSAGDIGYAGFVV